MRTPNRVKTWTYKQEVGNVTDVYNIDGKIIGLKAICIQCNNEFIPTSTLQMVCSRRCRRKIDSSKISTDCESGLSTGIIGSIHELQVSIDLMRRGYHVFRALSPSCPCDLIAMKNNTLHRIQVTKAKRYKSTLKICYPKHKESDYDILALSFTSGEIQYIPELKQ